MIVCLEGMDAVGKATQSKILADRLAAELFSFPNYNTIAGKAIKENLTNKWAVYDQNAEKPEIVAKNLATNALVLQALMLANRMEVGASIIEAVDTNGDVVLDRYDVSAMVYGTLDGLDPEWLRITNAQLPVRPDTYILLDAPVDESFKRRPERRDRYETDRGYLERVRDAYKTIFIQAPDPNAEYYIVDALGTVDEVADRIATALGINGFDKKVMTPSAQVHLAELEREFAEWKRDWSKDPNISHEMYAMTLDGWIKTLGDARAAAQREEQRR